MEMTRIREREATVRAGVERLTPRLRECAKAHVDMVRAFEGLHRAVFKRDAVPGWRPGPLDID